MRSGREKLAWLISAAALVAVAIFSTLILTSPSPPQPSTTSSSSTSPTTVVTQPNPADPGPARSRPVSLSVPTIGIAVPIGLLGLEPNGTVMVPNTAAEVGWFKLGPTPGQLGASVLLGHVDSSSGIGVFFWLKRLSPGSTINVGLANGVDLTFTVTRVAQFAKTAFPRRLVYTSPGTRSLNLVTCGGVFNQATGSYESNVVVFSQLTKVTPS